MKFIPKFIKHIIIALVIGMIDNKIQSLRDSQRLNNKLFESYQLKIIILSDLKRDLCEDFKIKTYEEC